MQRPLRRRRGDRGGQGVRALAALRSLVDPVEDPGEVGGGQHAVVAVGLGGAVGVPRGHAPGQSLVADEGGVGLVEVGHLGAVGALDIVGAGGKGISS